MNGSIFSPQEVFRGDLILVNAQHPLRPQPQPELVPVGGSRVLLAAQAAAALEALMEAIGGWKEILPVSGWRSQAEQQKIWNDSLGENGLVFTQTYVARPGCSEHQTGLAIDLGLRGDAVDFLRPDFPYAGLCQTFRQTMAAYGFIQRYPAHKQSRTGIGHEPWHFRYVGLPHARIMEERDLSLEEYIPWLRGFPYESCRYPDKKAFLSFLKAPLRRPLPLPQGDPGRWTVSGNNVDGFILTQWRASHG